MGKEKVVVEDYEVDITANGPQTPGDYGDFTRIVEQFSDVKADDKKLLKGPTVAFMASGCTLSGYTFVTGMGTLSTNTETKCEHLAHFKETATGNCAGMFTLNASPFTPFPCSCSLKISNAGQDDVLTT